MRVETKSGGARRLLARAVVALCVAASLTHVAAGAPPLAASTVRGRVDRQSASGAYPAPYVRVTIRRDGDAAKKLEAYTGKDGMYYFRDLQPGDYVLEIWNDANPVGRYRVNVQDKPFTDIRPITIS